MMEPTCKAQILKLKGSQRQSVEDTLIQESRLDIWLNGKKLVGVVSTPMELEALTVGYLISEHIITQRDDISAMRLSEDGMRIDVEVEQVNLESLKRLTSEAVMISGCGKGQTANIDPYLIQKVINQSTYSIPASTITDAMEGFMEHCKLYEQTGAVHTAQLIFEDGTYLVAEDLAQHNTIDKVMGKAAMAGREISRSLLLLSGRLSSEMVAKSVMHGVPIVASRTAATCLGVKIAEKFGVTLAGFVRGDRMNLYTVPERILVS
jgi:FdhD protein